MLIMLLAVRNLVGRRLLTRTLLIFLCCYQFAFAMTTFFCGSLDSVAARGAHLAGTVAPRVCVPVLCDTVRVRV